MLFEKTHGYHFKSVCEEHQAYMGHSPDAASRPPFFGELDRAEWRVRRPRPGTDEAEHSNGPGLSFQKEYL